MTSSSPVHGVEALAPFECAPMMKLTAGRSSRIFLLMFPLILLLGASASAIESTLGTSADFDPVQDVRRALDKENVAPAVPSFPYLRDSPSWFLALAIALTFVVVHRQWQLMSACVPDLRASKAIGDKPIPTWGRIHRLLGVERAVSRTPSTTPFDSLLVWLNNVFRRVGQANGVVVLFSSLGIMLVLIHLRDNGIFEVLAPPGQTAAEHKAWLDDSYRSWWASTTYGIGLSLYFLSATAAVALILLQNSVGLACVYIAISMPALLEFGADWTNRDGNYGWKPLASMYRTVILSLVLHFVTLLMLFWFLGPDNFFWLGLLAVVWTVVFPLYTFIPALVLRRSVREACRREVEAIDAHLAESLTRMTLTDAEESSLRHDFGVRRDRVHQARGKIHPLGIDRRKVIALLPTWVLPIFLTWISLS